MPGLVGYFNDEPGSNGLLTVAGMAQRLEGDARFQRDLYEDLTGGFGRVHLRLLNPQPQPVWNEDHTLGLVLEGELYDTDAPRRLVETRGFSLRDSGDAELALRMYEYAGDGFAAQLEGAFSIAVIDQRKNQLLLTNDRLGLYPVYYTWTQNRLLFASGVRALLADPELSRSIDPVAIVQLLTFDHMLDDHTLIRSVKLLPQASVLCYSGGRLSLNRYWFPQYAEVYPLRSEDSYVEELQHLLENAVKRQSGGDLQKGILLSGGVDSRVILGYMAREASPGSIRSFTFGIPGCDDVRTASEVARVLKTEHHFFELKPDWLLHKADEAVRVTDGHGNICNLHALASAEQEGGLAQVIYKGFMGDAMMGFAIRRRFFGNYSDEDLAEMHLNTYRDQRVLPFDPRDHAGIFTPDLLTVAQDCVSRDLRTGMLRSRVRQPSGQRLFFDMEQRVPRMTINGVEVVRSYAAVRLPFSDYRLWDFTMQVPPGYLFERYLYNRTFAENFPRLAHIPIAQTGLPLAMCAREVLAHNWKFIQWHLRARGLGKLAGPEARPYKDYALWFRTTLRDWVHDILLDSNALQRGYFQADTVRRLVAEHMAGANHSARLGLLLTVELWHRQFMDRR